MKSEIRNPELWKEGELKIEWVRRHMPLLDGLEAEFRKDKPFTGKKIALSVHLEAKTAHLCEVLAAGGAEMYITGSNPLSTQDDIAAALVHEGLNVFAVHGASAEEYMDGIRKVISAGPDIIIDDGGDLVNMIHTEYRELIPNVIGGCEETTTGILRLEAMDKAGKLEFPMMLVNNADCKHLFDNRYGTGQSVWDGINRTTNLIVAGKNEAETGIDDLIWPHSWDVTYGNVRLTLNGKEIRTYAVSSEYSLRTSDNSFGFATIGTFCHEFSHVLGLMDLYDTDYDANGSANAAWTETALMVGGNYNNDGQTPPCYNAIDRDMLDIGQRETLVPGNYELEPIRLNGRYLRYDTPTEGEYYLIECRDNEGWDEFIGGSGLAIYHIDKSQNMSGYSSYMRKNVTASTRWWTN